MKKAPLYSRSRSPAPAEPSAVAEAPSAPVAASALPPRRQTFSQRNERRLWIIAVLLIIASSIAFINVRQAGAPPLSFKQIDALLRKSIEEKPLRSASALAYDAIIPSVVRVVGLLDDDDDGSDSPEHGKMQRGVGSGVVIMENGTILTNYHVINGAKRIKVTFVDGLESDALVVNVQPENDLAVLRAQKLPDDLQPATMRSTGDLRPGDEVVAVGFPFGIGPSASAGIVSGLKREFRSPEGEQKLTNLIQFDAAANPGNSGGPLVTMDGEVVGIVTAILNPSHQRTFIGIGFAVPIENAAGAAGMPPF